MDYREYSWWERIKGKPAKDRSQALLREKDPPVEGLSAETAAAVDAGRLQIVKPGTTDLDDDQEEDQNPELGR